MKRSNNDVSAASPKLKTTLVAPLIALFGVMLTIASDSLWNYIKISSDQGKTTTNVFVLGPQVVTYQLTGATLTS